MEPIMEPIKVKVSGNIAMVTERPNIITAGTVGQPVEFTFDSLWDGLVKTAVFRAGSTKKVIDRLEKETIVPWEVLSRANVALHIGVYGVNAEGTVVIPTIWATVCPVCVATSPDGDPGIDPTLPVWQNLANDVYYIQQELSEVPEVVNSAIAVERSLASSDLDALADYGIKGFSRFVIEKGNISGTTGNNSSGGTIMRTVLDAGTIKAPADSNTVMTVLNNSGGMYQWRHWEYDADGNFVKVYNWCKVEEYNITLKAGYSYRFTFTDGAAVTDEDLANLPAMVYYLIAEENESNVYQQVKSIDERTSVLESKVAELETALPATLMEALGGSRASTNILTLTESVTLKVTVPRAQSFPVLFNAFAMYTGDEPTVRLHCGSMAAGLYTFGGKDYYISQQWRMPPLPWWSKTIRLDITIPKGTTVYIKDISMNYETARNQASTGVTMYGHLGVGCVYPHNTLTGFSMAAMCGFPACITNIKLTADGVMVCIHDPTINATAHNLDGSDLTEDIAVADKTYEELLQYEYGSWKNQWFLGEKLPTLEEFLDICAKTNMAPTFSIHPTLDTTTWQRIKDMLVKRNLLSSCVVKAGSTDMLHPAFVVLGSSISRYVYDVPGTDVATYIASMRSLFGETTAVKLVLEFNYKVFASDDELATVCDTAIDAGFIVSLYNHGAKSSEWYREMIRMGVTEFTEDWNTSNGLDF